MSALRWRSSTDLLGETLTGIAVGDLVRTGQNLLPHYHIIAISEDRAWIRDTQHGADHVVPVARCRRL